MEFFYGPDFARKKTKLFKSDDISQYLVKTKYFIGDDYEIEIDKDNKKRQLHYIGNFAIFVKENGNEKMYYLHKDFQNNYQTITDEQGTLVEELSFDPWGRRRNPTNWTFNDVPDNNLFDRGYTGHEHLAKFNLINPDIFHFITSSGLATSKFSLHYVLENQESANMNGRVYDPFLGRFLSPDNFACPVAKRIRIQESANSQNFNRYSYCLNNPLVYTDPSGEFPWIIIPIIVGSYLGGVGTNYGELNPGKWDWTSSETYFGIGFGAFMGYVGGYGLLHPGTVGLSLGIGTPLGGVYLVGKSSDWSFQWTTPAGGYGNISLGDKKKHESTITMPEKPKWNGPYYQGTEEEANDMLLSSSKMFNVETSYWYTTKGYYFEPIQGNAYGYKYDPISLSLTDYNTDLSYKANTINSTYRYTYVENINGGLYLIPNIFQSSRVYCKAHTHPGSNPPGSKDLQFSYLFRICGVVFGWNGTVYNYGGNGYWK